MWWQFKALVPSFLAHMAFTITVLSAAWYLMKRWNPSLAFKWYFPIVMGGLVSAFFTGDKVIHIYQSSALLQAQAERNAAETEKASVAAIPAPKNEQEFFQLKAEFLKIVEVLTNQPSQITPETKRQVFRQFQALFPNGDNDRMSYARAIMRAYECQKYFYEDALASAKAQKPIKSDERKQCEQEEGQFFNRPKLLPPEMIANNEKLIDVASGRKPADAGTPALNGSALRASLESQVIRMDGVRKLFE